LDCIQGPLAKGFGAWNARGIACFYLGRLADAFLAFEQAIVLDPCHEDVLMNLLDCGVRLRDLSRVQVYFERALALEPGLEEARRALEELQGGSVRALEDPVRWFELRDRNRSIENLIREGLLDQAHSEVHALLGAEPGSERAWNNKGLLLWYQGNVTAAWDCFYRAIELNPLFSDAVVNLYDAALLLDRKNAFEPILRRALELAPYHKELLQMRKELDSNLIPERLQGYLDQRYLGGRREEILADAEALIEKGDYVQAARLYLDLVDRDGQDAEAMNGLGLTAWYMGRTEDAWIAFKASAEMRVDEETLMNLWDTALALDRTPEISSLILNALEVDPQMHALRDLVRERLL
jgi:tetratricopeptide (TPR) repeat protein